MAVEFEDYVLAFPTRDFLFQVRRLRRLFCHHSHNYLRSPYGQAPVMYLELFLTYRRIEMRFLKTSLHG
jgi:hypothetical protein